MARVWDQDNWKKRKFGGLREMSVEEDCKSTHGQREPVWSNPRARATQHGTSYTDREPSSSIPRAQGAHHGGGSDLVSGGAKTLAIGDRCWDTENQKRKRCEQDDDHREGGDKNTREKSDSPSRGALRSFLMGKDTVAMVPEMEKKIERDEHQRKKLKMDERKHEDNRSDHGTRVKFSKHRDNSTREKTEVDSSERHKDMKRKRDDNEDVKGESGSDTTFRLMKHKDDIERKKSYQASGNDCKSLNLGPNDNVRELAVKERRVDNFAQHDKERGQKSMGIEHGQYGGGTRYHIEERVRNKDRKLKDKCQKTEGRQSYNFVGSKDWDPGKKNERLEPDKKKKLNDARKEPDEKRKLSDARKDSKQGKVEAVKKKEKSSDDDDDDEITISDVEKSFAFEGRIVGKLLTVADYSSSSDESEDSELERQQKKRSQRQGKECSQKRHKKRSQRRDKDRCQSYPSND